MSRRLLLSAPVALVLGALALVACGGSGSSSPSALPSGCKPKSDYHLLKAGEVSAVTGSQPPFIKVTADGHISGFIADLTDEAMRQLCLKVTYKVSTVPAAIQGVSSGRFDMVASGLGVTEERQKVLAFAKGLYWSKTAVLTRQKTPPASIKSLDGFAGKKVGAVTGSVQEKFIASHMPGAIETKFENQNSGISQLNSGVIDAFVVGGPDAESYMKQFADLRITVQAPVDHATTVAFRKEDTELARDFDAQIGRMIADGSFMKTWDKYFSEPPEPELLAIWPELKK